MLVPKSKEEPIEQRHLKKLRTIMNPINFNPNINIDYALKQSENKKASSYEIVMIMNHSNIVRYLEYLCLSGWKKY